MLWGLCAEDTQLLGFRVLGSQVPLRLLLWDLARSWNSSSFQRVDAAE